MSMSNREAIDAVKDYGARNGVNDFLDAMILMRENESSLDDQELLAFHKVFIQGRKMFAPVGG